MKKKQKRKIIGLDLTPLIDVVFLLIIFFMITTSFNNQNSILIDLPNSSMKLEDNKKTKEIIIDKNEKCYLFDNNVTIEIDIENMQKELLNTKEVLISADKDVKYQKIMDVITKIRENNVENVGLKFEN